MSEKPKPSERAIIVRCLRDASYYYNLGIGFHKHKQFESAVAAYDKAVALNPSYVDAWSNRGAALRALGQFESAVASYDKAIALNPSYIEAWYNRGNALRDLRQLEAALESYSRAIDLDPSYLNSYSNSGYVLKELKRFGEALASYDKVIALDSSNADAYWNKALILLLVGDYEKGLALYEWRWKNEKLSLQERICSQPLWLGRESLSGKTILLHCEQGLGDTIQFCRYVKMVAELGARVVLEVQKPLVSLLGQIEGVAEVVQQGRALPSFDMHCPLMSLPLAFNTTVESIPRASEYLKSDPMKVAERRRRLGTESRPRIGLVWSGNSQHTHDRHRSIELAELMKWLPPEFQYVSLQKELREVDRETLRSHDIVHFGEELRDFSDTAALCEAMDLVISVDTGVAHLAAALGRPTWVLLPFDPDWRWLLDRDDTPWYPGMSLYRQKSPGDWVSVFYRLGSGLLSLFSGSRNGC